MDQCVYQNEYQEAVGGAFVQVAGMQRPRTAAVVGDSRHRKGPGVYGHKQ